MNNRKYIGVPTQEEIKQQYTEVLRLTKGMKTYEEVKCFASQHPDFEIEINGENIDQYENDDNGNFKLTIDTVRGSHITMVSDEDIEMIRYEYKNILVYYFIEGGEGEYCKNITVYSDDGIEFADENYYDYEKVIEDAASRGLLELNPNF